jgi:hypothetical protein
MIVKLTSTRMRIERGSERDRAGARVCVCVRERERERERESEAVRREGGKKRQRG